MKLWWHKLWHWEYWPVWVVYAPTVLYWVWLAIRFRRIDFYRFSNPSIINGGLYADNKSGIYALLPFSTYPRTILVTQGASYDYDALLHTHRLQWPVIVKPDIGQRGNGVQKIYTAQALHQYAQTIGQHFLIQEVCDYPNEIGLFYSRLPGTNSGSITGITIKKLLIVTGDGRHTLRQLLQQVPRYALQLPVLEKDAHTDLDCILPEGKTHCVVPFGNHSRGTTFLDGKAYITPMLEDTFNRLLQQVPGFYYGRLDIRFNTWEELAAGKNFSIIEVNGAKSEPTHIYDPQHSFWYGQQEIFRHQLLFTKIIAANIRLHRTALHNTLINS